MKRHWDEWWPLLGAALLFAGMFVMLITSGGR